MEPGQDLKLMPASPTLEQVVHPQQVVMEEDTAVTKAAKIERHGLEDGIEESSAKRIRLEPSIGSQSQPAAQTKKERPKGVAPIKAEFLINSPDKGDVIESSGGAHPSTDARGPQKKEKSKGQNLNRDFGSSRDEIGLCVSRAHNPEFSPGECKFGDGCRFEHNLRRYLKNGKREDLSTFGGVCPIWKAKGKCYVGWKCRFVGSHMKEFDREDGRKELVLLLNGAAALGDTASEAGIINTVSTQAKSDLMKKKFPTPNADRYTKWLDINSREIDERSHRRSYNDAKQDLSADAPESHDNRARYTEPPFLPSEKRRIYFGPETPILAPLTTQGNLPFRRLCVDLGAQITYSEMAMSQPLIQGQKSEWALLRAHESELESPAYNPLSSNSSPTSTVSTYENAHDFRFGAQIAANKPWQALKATEILTRLTPGLRVIDLNCGCPIDLVYRAGAGSALLDTPSKLEKIVRGMNAVSGEIPITVKIRMGTKDNKPTAEKLIERLVLGGGAAQDSLNSNEASGTAAITLHGRSRQQRYTKNADWSYIASCAALISRLNARRDVVTDTIQAPDPRMQPPQERIFFLGNGDIYSHETYSASLVSSRVDSIMLARGALIKPWLFEEIATGQYIDKSATERLELVERYAKYGLETWGSDEMGVGTTRRFLLEWLSFACRYVPVGILEYLPPSLQDRPPAWRGRNELETLLGSGDYRDWIKISEIFLGPAHKNFKFIPKHKSNSYEIEAEG